MKSIKDTVISISEPPVNNVGWLKPLPNGTFMLYFFGAKGWVNLSESQPQAVGELNFQFIQEIPDIVINI